MVRVDFGNRFLRDLFPCWLALHERSLGEICADLPAWTAEAEAAERREAGVSGHQPRPLAIVFDIDEVLLCNIQLNGFAAPAGAQGGGAIDFHVADHFADPVSGAAWGRDDPCCPVLPGALALVQAALELGLRPFFVSGRLEALRDETVANFVRVGLAAPGGEALILCPPERRPAAGESIRPFKEGRRREIETAFRIVANIGDQASDLGIHGDHQCYLAHPFYFTP